MANNERPEERAARVVVEEDLGVPLCHADADGDVDYRFTAAEGRSGVLEVTAVTNQRTKSAWRAIDKARSTHGPAPSLRQCWQIWINESEATYKGLLDRLEPALATLEEAGRHYGRGGLGDFIGSPTAEMHAAAALSREKVTWAMPFPELCRAEGHERPHRIDLVMESGGTASGSDATLTLIEMEVNAKPDNFGKLRGGEVKHLFVWVDAATDIAVARPFRGGRAAKWEHFGLPTRAPSLLEPVDQLWIVDRVTSAGWVWTPAGGWRSREVAGAVNQDDAAAEQDL